MATDTRKGAVGRIPQISDSNLLEVLAKTDAGVYERTKVEKAVDEYIRERSTVRATVKRFLSVG